MGSIFSPQILHGLDSVGGAVLANFIVANAHFFIRSEYLFEPLKAHLWRGGEGVLKRVAIGWHDDEQIDRKIFERFLNDR